MLNTRSLELLAQVYYAWAESGGWWEGLKPVGS